jgi:hypothetical protein
MEGSGSRSRAAQILTDPEPGAQKHRYGLVCKFSGFGDCKKVFFLLVMSLKSFLATILAFFLCRLWH